MRITKKFSGAACIGKLAFQPCTSVGPGGAFAASIADRMAILWHLESTFLGSLAPKAGGSSTWHGNGTCYNAVVNAMDTAYTSGELGGAGDGSVQALRSTASGWSQKDGSPSFAAPTHAHAVADAHVCAPPEQHMPLHHTPLRRIHSLPDLARPHHNHRYTQQQQQHTLTYRLFNGKAPFFGASPTTPTQMHRSRSVASLDEYTVNTDAASMTPCLSPRHYPSRDTDPHAPPYLSLYPSTGDLLLAFAHKAHQSLSCVQAGNAPPAQLLQSSPQLQSQCQPQSQPQPNERQDEFTPALSAFAHMAHQSMSSIQAQLQSQPQPQPREGDGEFSLGGLAMDHDDDGVDGVDPSQAQRQYSKGTGAISHVKTPGMNLHLGNAPKCTAVFEMLSSAAAIKMTHTIKVPGGGGGGGGGDLWVDAMDVWSGGAGKRSMDMEAVDAETEAGAADDGSNRARGDSAHSAHIMQSVPRAHSAKRSRSEWPTNGAS